MESPKGLAMEGSSVIKKKKILSPVVSSPSLNASSFIYWILVFLFTIFNHFNMFDILDLCSLRIKS